MSIDKNQLFLSNATSNIVNLKFIIYIYIYLYMYIYDCVVEEKAAVYGPCICAVLEEQYYGIIPTML